MMASGNHYGEFLPLLGIGGLVAIANGVCDVGYCRTELHPNRVKEWAELIFAVTRTVVESRIQVRRKASQRHGLMAVDNMRNWPRWQRPPPGDLFFLT